MYTYLYMYNNNGESTLLTLLTLISVLDMHMKIQTTIIIIHQRIPIK